MEKWVLYVRGLSKRYGPDVLFEEVDLAIKPGEAIHITGPNGSGKTQFLLAIAGLVEVQQGIVELEVDGLRHAVPRDPHRRDSYLRFVPDSVAALRELRLDELHLACGRNLGAPRLRSRVGVLARAFDVSKVGRELFVGAQLSAAGLVGRLSVGQQKRLALYAALSAKAPRVLLVDEPLAGLDGPGVDVVVSALAEVRRQGTALLIAEHRNQIMRIGFDAELTMPHLRAKAPKGTSAPHFDTENQQRVNASSTPPYLIVRDGVGGYRGACVRCELLTVRRGEVVVFSGPNGAGKTGFLKSIAGMPGVHFSGLIEVAGQPVRDLGEFVRLGRVRYMSQIRRSFSELTARDALRASALGTDMPPEVANVAAFVGPSKRVKTLSSGNLALLCLGQALATKPDLVLLDEPFANVDATNREHMFRLISYARSARHTAFVIVDHDQVPLDGRRYHVEEDVAGDPLLRPAA